MGRLVEPHGFTAVPPPTALRRAEPSDPSAKAYGRRAEAYPPPPRLRTIPFSHSSTALHPLPSAKEGKKDLTTSQV
jgi:hypothetical protein